MLIDLPSLPLQGMACLCLWVSQATPMPIGVRAPGARRPGGVT